MKITKEKAEENRASLVKAASRLFREKGIDGVGVAEISKQAGLTHGALYAHFKSKEELAAEALTYGMEQSNALLYGATVNGMPDLDKFLDYYLSLQRRDTYGDHCALAASASEIGRQDEAVSARFTEGYMVTVRAFEQQIAANNPDANALEEALTVVASLIGGLAVARATAKANPAISEQVLAGVRHMAEALLQKKPAKSPRKK
jgi:TetR/AcrR family transcriptional regulator, transcriptional repressor for nem operon